MKDQKKGADREVRVPSQMELHAYLRSCVSLLLFLFSFLSFFIISIFLCLVLLTKPRCSD